MEPTKKTILHPSASTPISIGNFQIMSEPHQNSFQISLSKSSKIQISVVEEMNNYVVGANEIERGDYNFVLANPNDSDNETKDLLKEVLNLYMKELPAMNYAANTGKESRFLEKCLTNGKYCSLVLKSKEEHVEVIAAITYQIIPADTQYAEVPLAAVSSICQRKGFGRLLYSELRNRLLNVGMRNVLCWGDKESEGFWLKQGFMVIGKVNKKGRAQRLPIKADIRKTLCFPGDSTLMVSHLPRDSLSTPLCLVPVPTKQTGMNVQNEEIEPISVSYEAFKEVNHRTRGEFSESGKLGILKLSSNGSKKRTWEASRTSLKSKKVKGTQLSDFQTGSQYPVWTSEGKIVNLSNRNDLSNSGDVYFSDDSLKHSGNDGETNEECREGDIMVDYDIMEIPPTANCIQIMLMNIADDNKKSNLTKVIEDLGGVVTYDGCLSTHVITGQVRKTLNFCTALCSGSWIVSSGWLKESFKKGKFVDETPFILDDEEYKTQYRTELRCAVLRAKANPKSLLRGLDFWLSTHVQPPARTLSAIVKCAGGNVIKMSEMKDVSKTIFVACEEDMEEARLAVKLGTWTFSVDWLMNCIMKQELDLDAPQFAESL